MKKIRVLVAKLGLDGHDRGAKVVARALRDAGMEVIYTGIRQTPEQIASTVVQEDVDCLGLSILSGAHMGLMSKLMKMLTDNGVPDKIVLVGGAIPKSDLPKLKALGINGVFSTGSSVKHIIEFVKNNVQVSDRL